MKKLGCNKLCCTLYCILDLAPAYLIIAFNGIVSKSLQYCLQTFFGGTSWIFHCIMVTACFCQLCISSALLLEVVLGVHTSVQQLVPKPGERYEIFISSQLK